ncbi:MAG: OsmC family protein [Spirochaetia bacterium]|jgi:putative redox protein
MPSELTVRAVHKGGMRMVATAGSHSLTMDYPLNGEQAAGMKPLEVLLSSLAACGGSTVALLLQRAKQPVSGVEVIAHAVRRDEHPTVLTEISLEFLISGAGVEPAAVERIIATADEKLCPVWAMLKAGTPVRTSYRIVAAGG